MKRRKIDSSPLGRSMAAARRARIGLPPAVDPLQAILDDAPDVPGYGGGKWAMYGVHCCWWTSDPDLLGRSPRSSIPCCPHCESPLFQAPLGKFIGEARRHEEHYGPGGLATFAAAHNAPCHPTWDAYPAEVKP